MATLPSKIYQETDVVGEVTVRTNGVIQDVTGSTAILYIRTYDENVIGSSIELQISGVLDAVPTSGKISFTIDDSETDALDTIKHIYEVRWTKDGLTSVQDRNVFVIITKLN